MTFKWHKMDWENPSGLVDHCYYLITHKGYKTPLKAKWHNEMGGCFEALGVTYGFDIGREFWYSWEPNNPIIAWMELPDIYKEDEDNDRTGKNDGVSCDAGDQRDS